MSKAEERALERFNVPKNLDEESIKILIKFCSEYIDGYHQAEKDLTDKARLSSGLDGFYYGQGYKQAEKDLELTWKDIAEIEKITNLLETEWLKSTPWDGIKDWGFYQEVLKRFKERNE